MDVYDSILKSIIEGNHRYEKMLTKTNKNVKTSRATFDRHLKQLVKDGYLVRNDKGKQVVEYHIKSDAFDVAQGFLEDHGEKELEERIKEILGSDIDYSKAPKDSRDKLIQGYDELLYIYLIKQNLSTLVIHSLYDGNVTAQNKAKKFRDEYDNIIKLILAVIKKINPTLYKTYPGFTFLNLQKDPISVLNNELITQMEAFGVVFDDIKKQRKKSTKSKID